MIQPTTTRLFLPSLTRAPVYSDQHLTSVDPKVNSPLIFPDPPREWKSLPFFFSLYLAFSKIR